MNNNVQQQLDQDMHFMAEALKEAKAALAENEVPIGAVVVSNGRIIGRGHNMTERLSDVTAHAEMIALTAAANTLGGKYVDDTTLYVTVEPCLMCAGAIGWSQCRRIVYATGDSRRGYTAFTDKSPFHPKAEITTGILAEEAAELMKSFFKQKR